MESIGTHVNLRTILTPQGLSRIKKGQILHFEMSDGTQTWIKVIRAGFLRYEGVVVEPLKTPEEAQKESEKAEETFAKEVAKDIIPEDVTDKVQVIKKPKQKKEKSGF